MSPDRIRVAVQAGTWAALASAGLGAGVLLAPSATATLLRIWLLVLGLILLGVLVRLATGAWREDDGPSWRLRLGGRRPRERVRQLEELERLTEFSSATAFDFHYRLRPRLTRVAEHKLGLKGVRLAAQPERARALLGDATWELIRPDRPEPDNRHGPGISPSLRRQVVETLDAL